MVTKAGGGCPCGLRTDDDQAVDSRVGRLAGVVDACHHMQADGADVVEALQVAARTALGGDQYRWAPGEEQVDDVVGARPVERQVDRPGTVGTVSGLVEHTGEVPQPHGPAATTPSPAGPADRDG